MRPDVHWVPFLTLFIREVRRFLRVVFQTVVTPLVNSSLYLFIFGVSLGRNISLGEGVHYLSFLIPGLITMTAMNNAFMNSSGSIVTAKFAGELEDYKVVPLSRFQMIWAFSLGALLRGWMVGLVTFLVGEVFHYSMLGTPLTVAHPFLLFFFVSVGCLILAKVGIWLGFVAKNFDQLNGVTAFILLPLLYLGGVFFSLEGLHPVWQLIGKINPIFYLVNGVRYSVMEISDVTPITAVSFSLVGLVASHFIAMAGIRWGSFERW